jgi:hypothetical protein
MKLSIVVYSFYFNNGVWVTWRPLKEDGKAHDLFNVVIEFPPTEAGSDIVKMEKHGPPTAHTSQHLLKLELKNRKNKIIIYETRSYPRSLQ